MSKSSRMDKNCLLFLRFASQEAGPPDNGSEGEHQDRKAPDPAGRLSVECDPNITFFLECEPFHGSFRYNDLKPIIIPIPEKP